MVFFTIFYNLVDNRLTIKNRLVDNRLTIEYGLVYTVQV